MLIFHLFKFWIRPTRIESNNYVGFVFTDWMWLSFPEDEHWHFFSICHTNRWMRIHFVWLCYVVDVILAYAAYRNRYVCDTLHIDYMYILWIKRASRNVRITLKGFTRACLSMIHQKDHFVFHASSSPQFSLSKDFYTIVMCSKVQTFYIMKTVCNSIMDKGIWQWNREKAICHRNSIENRMVNVGIKKGPGKSIKLKLKIKWKKERKERNFSFFMEIVGKRIQPNH